MARKAVSYRRARRAAYHRARKIASWRLDGWEVKANLENNKSRSRGDGVLHGAPLLKRATPGRTSWLRRRDKFGPRPGQ